MIHGFFLSMGGFAIADGDRLRIVTPNMVGDVVRPDEIAAICAEDIADRSKGDALSKGLAVVQTVWFAMQCSARAAQDLPITELEVVTLAFVALNLVTYIVWWNKPLNVRRAILLRGHINHDAMSGLEGERRHATERHTGWRFLRDEVMGKILDMIFGAESDRALPLTATRLPTLFIVSDSHRHRMLGAIAALLLAMGFAAIHCIAWSFAFPSDVERVLWRTSSVITLGVPAVCAFLFIIVTGEIFADLVPHNWFDHFTGLSMLVYVVARIILLVQPLVALRALSDDAYRSVAWVSYLPHI